MQNAASHLGVKALALTAATDDEVNAAFASAPFSKGAGAMLVSSDPFFNSRGADSSRRPPAICCLRFTRSANMPAAGASSATDQTFPTAIATAASISAKFSEVRALQICR